MSINTNTTTTGCIPRIAPVENGSIVFSISCTPRSNGSQAKCVVIPYNNQTVIPANTDCTVVTSNGWANTVVKIDAASHDCQSTCKFLPSTTNNTTKVLIPSTNNSTATNGSITTNPQFPMTALLLCIVLMLFYKR